MSPVLANVYLHYALDLWYEKVIRKQCQGEVYYVRYADDFLMLFQYENEAKAVMEALKKAHRMDLVGFDKHCLIRPRKENAGKHVSQGKHASQGNRQKKKSIRNVHKKK